MSSLLTDCIIIGIIVRIVISADPYCDNGIITEYSGSTICCQSSCGICVQDSECSTRGGESFCCPSRIKINNANCNVYPFGCIVTSTRAPTTAIATSQPSQSPTTDPTTQPSTLTPSKAPSSAPSTAITTTAPSNQPSEFPTGSPTYPNPTNTPTISPSESPSETPTLSPSTSVPTHYPSEFPSTLLPSVSPTNTASTFSPTTDQPSAISPTNGTASMSTAIQSLQSPTFAPTISTRPPIRTYKVYISITYNSTYSNLTMNNNLLIDAVIIALLTRNHTNITFLSINKATIDTQIYNLTVLVTSSNPQFRINESSFIVDITDQLQVIDSNMHFVLQIKINVEHDTDLINDLPISTIHHKIESTAVHMGLSNDNDTDFQWWIIFMIAACVIICCVFTFCVCAGYRFAQDRRIEKLESKINTDSSIHEPTVRINSITDTQDLCESDLKKEIINIADVENQESPELDPDSKVMTPNIPTDIDMVPIPQTKGWETKRSTSWSHDSMMDAKNTQTNGHVEVHGNEHMEALSHKREGLIMQDVEGDYDGVIIGDDEVITPRFETLR